MRPPPRLRFSAWIEQHLLLPDGVSALPGPVRLWPYQRAIAGAIGDPAIECVTVVNPVRAGFTTLLTGAIASYVANDPAPMFSLLPVEADLPGRRRVGAGADFAASPAVRGLLAADTDEAARNTLASRRFPGGSLNIWRARPPEPSPAYLTRPRPGDSTGRVAGESLSSATCVRSALE